MYVTFKETASDGNTQNKSKPGPGPVSGFRAGDGRMQDDRAC